MKYARPQTLVTNPATLQAPIRKGLTSFNFDEKAHHLPVDTHFTGFLVINEKQAGLPDKSSPTDQTLNNPHNQHTEDDRTGRFC